MLTNQLHGPANFPGSTNIDLYLHLVDLGSSSVSVQFRGDHGNLMLFQEVTAGEFFGNVSVVIRFQINNNT